MEIKVTYTILCICWGIVAGAALGFALRNYRDIKILREAVCKLIADYKRMQIEKEAEKLARLTTDLIIGDTKPDDLEKAIKEVANNHGCKGVEVEVQLKKSPEAEKVTKKTTRKTAKKTTKKEEK